MGAGAWSPPSWGACFACTAATASGWGTGWRSSRLVPRATPWRRAATVASTRDTRTARCRSSGAKPSPTSTWTSCARPAESTSRARGSPPPTTPPRAASPSSSPTATPSTSPCTSPSPGTSAIPSGSTSPPTITPATAAPRAGPTSRTLARTSEPWWTTSSTFAASTRDESSSTDRA